MLLVISATPKVSPPSHLSMEIHSAILQVHMVFQHVQEFLEMVNTDPNQPALGMVNIT